MKEYQLEKVIDVQYLDDNKEWSIRKVPIYAIPINKKGYCRPFLEVENKKGEIEMKPACKNFYNRQHCNVCVNTAKQIYKMR